VTIYKIVLRKSAKIAFSVILIKKKEKAFLKTFANAKLPDFMYI